MRILGLVLALLLTLSVAAAALTYGYSRQGRIYIHGNGHSSPVHNPYNDIGNPQRYYSHSEGWTYYNLPRFSTHQVP
jgi:hypothetical protein